MILVVSPPEDAHAQAVLENLEKKGVPATLLDTSRFPQQVQLSIDYNQTIGQSRYSLTLPDGRLELSACGVIWWRRPQPFELHAEIGDPAHRAFAFNESYEALSGFWLALDAFWINHPMRDQEASRKAYQLKIAREMGFETPATLITSNPQHARDFIAAFGPDRTIYKAFSATEQNWRETRILRPGEEAMLDSVKFAPVIFQEYIPARADLRITMIGGEIFPAAVYSQETSYQQDYRMEVATAHVEATALPPSLEERLRAFMNRMGLVYGAIDMRLTPDGRYVFLEINPSGQWLFMERRTGQPITESFVRLLAKYGEPKVQ